MCQHFKEECFRRIRLGSVVIGVSGPVRQSAWRDGHVKQHNFHPNLPYASLLYQANASAWEIVTCLRLVFGRTLRVLTRMRDTWFGLGAGLSALPRGVCSHVVICSIEVQ